jgi:hypothetical protein
VRFGNRINWVVPDTINAGVPFAVVALFAFPLLSAHAVTVEVPVIEEESAASSHKERPGIDWGENGHKFLDVVPLRIDIINLEQNITGVSTDTRYDNRS